MYGFFLGFVAIGGRERFSAALAMSVVGFAASWLKAVFFADNLVLNDSRVRREWVFDVLFLILGRHAHGAELMVQMFVWSPTPPPLRP
jgi:rod shape-determining protein MreD